MGLKRLQNDMFAREGLAKKYKSELIVHHPPSTSHSKPNQPTYVMAIPGRSPGAPRRAGFIIGATLRSKGSEDKNPARRGAPGDRRDGSSYTTLSS